MEAPESDASPSSLTPRVRRCVALWLVAATVVAVTVVVWDVTTGVAAPPWPLIGMLVVLISVMELANIEVRVLPGRASEATTLAEVGILPAILLLDPTWAVLTTVTAALLADLLVARKEAAKIAFNVSWQVLGAALGAAIFHALASPATLSSASGLAAALVAALVVIAVNLAAVSTIFSAIAHLPVRSVLADEAPSSAVVDLVIAVTGVVLAVLLVEVPLAAPLILAPLLLYRGRARARSEGVEQLQRERDRFERTVAGASDGVVLLAADGHIEVWNPAMEALSGRTRDEALGRRPDAIGLAALVHDDDPEAATTSPLRLSLPGGDVEIRSSRRSPGTGTVLVVQDVSREVELGRLRENLVSRVSHELRTPLTSVEGFLETLDVRWEELTETQRRELLAVTRRGGRRLGHLVDTLMLWSGIEARTTGFRVGAQDGPVCDAAAVLRHVLATDDDDVVAHPVPPVDAVLCVGMAAEDLATVVDQLLENAWRYGAPPVTVGLHRDDGSVRLTVRDEGPGLPADILTDLFEPFRQVGEDLQRTGRGLGLGLAIVQRLVRDAGGTVAVHSPPSGGATFQVDLPLHLGPPATTQADGDSG